MHHRGLGGVLKHDHIAERGSTSVGLHTFMYAPLPRETFSDSVALYPTPFLGLFGGLHSTGCAPHLHKGGDVLLTGFVFWRCCATSLWIGGRATGSARFCV